MKKFIQNLPVLDSSELKIINKYIDNLEFEPNSVFGIGRTFIGRYTNTNPSGIENSFSEKFPYGQTFSLFVEDYKGFSTINTVNNVREQIYGEIPYNENLTKEFNPTTKISPKPLASSKCFI